MRSGAHTLLAPCHLLRGIYAVQLWGPKVRGGPTRPAATGEHMIHDSPGGQIATARYGIGIGGVATGCDDIVNPINGMLKHPRIRMVPCCPLKLVRHTDVSTKGGKT